MPSSWVMGQAFEFYHGPRGQPMGFKIEPRFSSYYLGLGPNLDPLNHETNQKSTELEQD